MRDVVIELGPMDGWPPDFEARREDGGGLAVVAVAGEVDIATAGKVREQCSYVPATDPLILDLSAVTFMDSSGLRVLLDERERRGERLQVVWQTGGAVARLLQIAQIPFRSHEQRSDAVAAARSSG